MRFIGQMLTVIAIFISVQVYSEQNQIVIGSAAEPANLDPHLFKGATEAQILKDLFEGLVIYQEGGIKPGNADWEILENGLKYRFHLKPDLRWSDGTLLEAEDYVYSFRRAIDPATGANYSWYFKVASIKNASEILSGSLTADHLGVKAIDAKTLDIELEKPVTYFLKLMDFPIFLPVPRKTIEKDGAKWAIPGNMVNNGAYQLSDWQPDEKVVLSKNSLYHASADTHIETVIYRPFKDQDEEIDQYLAGKIDITSGVPFDRYRELKAKRPGELIDDPSLKINLLMFNVRAYPAFQDDMRKALAYSLDRDELLKLDHSEHSRALFRLTPPTLDGYNLNKPEYSEWTREQRHQEAVRLYTKLGYNKENPLEISLMHSNRKSLSELADLIASMWQQVLGVRVSIQKEEWAAYANRLFNGRFEVVMCPWLGAFDDPDAFMELMVSDFQNNVSGFNDALYDQFVRSARVMANPKKRWQQYQKASDILDQDMPVIPLQTLSTLRMVSSGVEGYIRDDNYQFFYSRLLKIKKP